MSDQEIQDLKKELIDTRLALVEIGRLVGENTAKIKALLTLQCEPPNPKAKDRYNALCREYEPEILQEMYVKFKTYGAAVKQFFPPPQIQIH